MRAYFIMLTNDKMAVVATLEISFTKSFNLVSKSLKSRKIAMDVDYDSSEDTKETRGVDGYFRSLSACSLPTYIAISLYLQDRFHFAKENTWFSVLVKKENIPVLMCGLPN